MQKVLKDNLQKVNEILKKHKVDKAYVFGSVCTDKFTDESDIDFIIAFNKIPFDGYADNFFSLAEQLEKLLKRKVDLVPEHTLTNPYFIKKMNQTKTPLYE